MPLTIVQGVVVGALALAVPAGGYWLGQMGSTDVRFLRGTDTATMAGLVTGAAPHDYRVKAAAGQQLEVALAGPPQVGFDVLAPGSDRAIGTGSGAQGWRGTVPDGGAYTIRVHHQPGSDAGGSDAFDLKVSRRDPAGG
ncbi:hypothetical protein PK98_08220 [Croceibacterium mercuriale]|uniref:Uncharacterized protein n=1 Tax=Croceibacterium mercuriale TaxID=1572751 RepID=A0A0B2BY86_9SPHN|nr:hypothetical protein [Croceibacterium mercuriale]KHL26414.1 hypothetical protein PK98_08220 [Croceibacterium mercuriale]